MEKEFKKVVVLGASANSEKYSYKAVKMLKEYGHTPLPVHPSGKSVCEVETLRDLSQVPLPIDTVTLYLSEKNSASLNESILALKPKRIIMNPGAESGSLKMAAERAGIEVVEGCTLVMLRTEVF